MFLLFFKTDNFYFWFYIVASEIMKIVKIEQFSRQKIDIFPNINNIIDLGSTIVNWTCRFFNKGLLKIITVVTLT